MKIDFENAKIYVRPRSTDLRKGATGLAQIIENEMKLNNSTTQQLNNSTTQQLNNSITQ